MGILVSIILAIVGGVVIDNFRTKRINKEIIKNFNNEAFSDFNNLFKNVDNITNHDEKINHLTNKMYHLAFLRAGKKTVELGQLGMVNLPEQLKQQAKYVAVHETIKESLLKTLYFIKVNNYKMDYSESLQTFDVMVDEISNIINNKIN